MSRSKFHIQRDILNGNILQQMLLFFFPVFCGYLLQQIYGFADTIILGKFVGKGALASVGGSATSIINVIINCISGLTSAVMVLTAQSYGKTDRETIQKTIRTGMFLSVVIGCIMSVLVFVASETLLYMARVPEEIMNDSLTYLRFYALSIIPYFVYQSGVSIFRAGGDSRRPLYFIAINVVTKISFDLLFAGVFRWGVTGTSVATLLSYLFCAFGILLIFDLTGDVYHYSLKEFGADRKTLGRMLQIGIPFSINSMMYALPTTLIQAKINGFGTDAIAAYSAYCNVDNFFWCFSNAVNVSLVTLAGQNYGKGNISRVRRITRSGAFLQATGAIIFSTLFYLKGKDILSLFSSDPDVLYISTSMLKKISRFYIIYTAIETVSSISKACGFAKASMYIAISCICGTRLLYILLFPQTSVYHPLYAFPLSWAVAGTAFTIYYLTNRKFRE